MKRLTFTAAAMSAILSGAIFAQAPAPAPQRFEVNVTDATNAPVANAQVAVILKSGAYQDAKLENGTYVCEPTGPCVKIFVGAPGYEASCMKVANATAGTFAVKMKPSATKNSAVMHAGWGKLPGIEGDVSPVYDNLKRTYIFTKGIGLFDKGKPANQPLKMELNKSIQAESPTGKKFTMWVMEITQEVSLLEYTMPES